MALTIETFTTELRADIEKFEAAYRKKAAENPEHYPLEMSSGNEGLWLEFFVQFVVTREA